jgi:hypothetical protein
MNNYIFVILLLLAGCGPRAWDEADLEKFRKACAANNGELLRVLNPDGTTNRARCVVYDGKTV